MIEPTDEMVHAFMRGYAAADDGSSDVILNWTAERAGLAAVLALVERDYDVRAARQSLPPCGAEGPDGFHCERNPHTPDSAHGALVNDELVRW